MKPLLCTLALLAAAPPLPAVPIPQYSVEVLSDKYGEAWDQGNNFPTISTTINNNGDIAGTESRPGDNIITPFYLLDGKAGFVDHVLPGDWRSAYDDINDSGQIIGTSIFTGSDLPYGGSVKGVIISGGVTTEIGRLPGNYPYIEMRAINNAGQVVGSSAVGTVGEADESTHAFLWEAGSGMRDLGSLEGGIGDSSVAWNINEAGVVVGSSHSSGAGGHTPVLWKPTGAGTWQIQAFAQFAGVKGDAIDINNDGSIIVGEAGEKAFILKNNVMIPDVGEKLYYTPGGVEVDLSLSSRAFRVNELGMVLGSTYWQFDGTYHEDLWLWSEESGTVFLDDLQLEAGQFHFGVGTFVNSWDLNDKGELVGIANRGNELVTVFLHPVPEPGALVLLALGGTGLLILRRREDPASF